MSVKESVTMNSSSRCIQCWMGAALLAFLATGVATIGILARNEALATVLAHLDQQVNRQDKNRYSYEHYFPDWEDRLINEELRQATYSDGGVYLIGTSNLKWATRFWELRQPEQSLVHNYGIGATDHRQQFEFIRYLVEHENLLQAGGHKNMVILGTSYHSTGDGSNDPHQFFRSLWQRHGLYTYQADTGITPLNVSRWRRAILLERIRVSGFIRSVIYTVARQLGYHTSVRRHDFDAYRKERREWMGSNWKETMRLQVGEFEAMADYLQSRGVRMVVAILPLGSWDDGLPFQRTYVEAITEVCRRKSVTIVDWSKLLDDDDFADSNHPNPYGVDKLQPRFLELAFDFLRSSHTLQPLSGHRETLLAPGR